MGRSSSERCVYFFVFQAEDGIRDVAVTGVQTCALPISKAEYEEGRRFVGTSPRSLIGGLQGAKINTRKDDEGYGAVRAIDPMTGDRKWEFKIDRKSVV